MKNKLLLTALLFTISFYGQEKYEPGILILTPFSLKYDKDFNKEISKINERIKEIYSFEQSVEYLDSPNFKNLPENIQIMIKSETEYSKNLSFYNNASYISEQFLVYRLIEKLPNLLIEISNEKIEGGKKELELLAKKKGLQYVLNFPSIRTFIQDGESYTEIEFQLYDKKQKSILLQKKYIGDSSNPGFEFACEDQSIGCTLNNALSQGLNETSNIIAANSPSLQREKELSQLRYNELFNKYYHPNRVNDFVKEIIAHSDLKIDSNLFQSLVNQDSTKFVAFYIKKESKQDLKSLNDKNEDNQVTIITYKSLNDKEFFDVPKTSAFLIRGVQIKNEWFLKKSNSTYFETSDLDSAKKEYFNNLQKWSFFDENSTDFNNDFWNAELFEKVPDLKKDPEWDEYGDSIWKTEEINNRDYIGLYEIVVDKMIKDLKKENDSFEDKTEKIFQKKYDSLESKNPAKYSKISKHALIFPKDRKYALNPVLIENDQNEKTIHYFLLTNNSYDFYEWTYLDPKILDDNDYGDDVVDQISKLTDWNFSVFNLNDSKFWEEYVFKKEKQEYSYLIKIE